MQAEADSYVQVITAGEEPFQIVWASEAWLTLCEYTAPQVLGHTFALINGPQTLKENHHKSVGLYFGEVAKLEDVEKALAKCGKAR